MHPKFHQKITTWKTTNRDRSFSLSASISQMLEICFKFSLTGKFSLQISTTNEINLSRYCRINDELVEERIIVNNIDEDLYDGQVLHKLWEKLTGNILDVLEVTQSEEGQRQKLTVVLNAVNHVSRFSSSFLFVSSNLKIDFISLNRLSDIIIPCQSGVSRASTRKIQLQSCICLLLSFVTSERQFDCRKMFQSQSSLWKKSPESWQLKSFRNKSRSSTMTLVCDVNVMPSIRFSIMHRRNFKWSRNLSSHSSISIWASWTLKFSTWRPTSKTESIFAFWWDFSAAFSCLFMTFTWRQRIKIKWFIMWPSPSTSCKMLACRNQKRDPRTSWIWILRAHSVASTTCSPNIVTLLES